MAMLIPAPVSNIAMALQLLSSTERVVFPSSFSLVCKETLLIGTSKGFLFFVVSFFCRSFVLMLCLVQNSFTFGSPMNFSHRLGLIFNRFAKGIVHVTSADINACKFATSFSGSLIGMFGVGKGTIFYFGFVFIDTVR